MFRPAPALVTLAAFWACADAGLPLGPAAPDPAGPPIQPEPCTDPSRCKVSEYALGAQHVCARFEGGSVACWGNNEHGQSRPDRRTVVEASPVIIEGLPRTTAIATGADHSCAVIDGGQVECWGNNELGQLGIGTDAPSAPPTIAEGPAGIEQIVAGYGTTCAADRSRRWWCWGTAAAGGDGSFGSHVRSLGVVGTEEHQTIPGRAFLADGAETIALGSYLGCAQSQIGEVRCWGYWQREGGYGWRSPTVVEGVKAEKLVAGGFSACALADRQVSCWSTFDLSARPVVGITAAIDLAAIGDTFCALEQNGRTQCWPTDPNSTEAFVLTPVRNLGDSTAIMGGGMLCGEVPDRGTWCTFTNNDYGQHGDGTALISPEPRLLGMEARDLSGGLFHLCALRPGGTVDCWGDYQPTVRPSRIWPTPVRGLTGAKAIDDDCALLDGGAVQCWSEGDWGGDEPSAAALPAPIVPAVPFEAIAIGLTSGCGLTRAGAVECWQQASDTQPGTYTMLAAGSVHTCGIVVGGEVRCWGGLYTGRIEDGRSEMRQADIAERIDLPGPATALWADGAGTCARLEGEAVWCWGRIPIDDQDEPGEPAVHVPALDGARSISIGSDGVCFVDRNEAAHCLGSHQQGLNGTNDFGLAISTPIAGATRVVRGGVFGCAIRDRGNVCWGHGGYGIFADGTGPTPTTVFKLGP